LKVIRKRGYSVDDGETADDLYCISVPLKYGRQKTAAVSIAFPREAACPQRLKVHLDLLNACVAAIRRKLGTGRG
jgi:DNA-binding IclR family transcriptional regulator